MEGAANSTQHKVSCNHSPTLSLFSIKANFASSLSTEIDRDKEGEYERSSVLIEETSRSRSGLEFRGEEISLSSGSWSWIPAQWWRSEPCHVWRDGKLRAKLHNGLSPLHIPLFINNGIATVAIKLLFSTTARRSHFSFSVGAASSLKLLRSSLHILLSELTPSNVHKLRQKSKADSLAQLKDLKAELALLRVTWVTGGAPNKLSKIMVVRLSIAQVLTVISENQKAALREVYKKKKFIPLDLRPK
ncbi:hypothetical protein Droror1_Dr00023459 [Drosera rotundifolia]